jgi:hypothetical protein
VRTVCKACLFVYVGQRLLRVHINRVKSRLHTVECYHMSVIRRVILEGWATSLFVAITQTLQGTDFSVRFYEVGILPLFLVSLDIVVSLRHVYWFVVYFAMLHGVFASCVYTNKVHKLNLPLAEKSTFLNVPLYSKLIW